MTDRVAFGKESDLVYSNFTLRSRVLDRRKAEILMRCDRFRRLSEHADHLCRRWQLKSSHRRALNALLARLANEGLLLSKDDLPNYLKASRPVKRKPLRFSSIAIPTCQRVARLRQGLASYMEYSLRYGRGDEFMVSDDSPQAGTRAACKTMLAELSKKYGVKVRYAGYEEKINYVKELARKSGLPRRIIQSAILGERRSRLPTIGANRNSILLDTQGTAIFSADDDTMCRVAAAPDSSSKGVLITGGAFRMRQWLFSDRESCLDAVRSVDVDILGLQETLLGANLAECARSSQESCRLEFGDMGARLARLLGMGGGRVLFTMPSLLGDFASQWRHMPLNPASRAQWLQDEATYRKMLRSRQVLIDAEKTVVGPHIDLCTAFWGVDNRDILPPFIPIGRGEDVLFGLMSKLVVKDACFARLPWALYHLPADRGPAPENMAWRSLPWLTIAEVIDALMHNTHFTPGPSPEHNLRSLGRYFREIAALPASDFEELVRRGQWDHWSENILELEGMLKAYQWRPAFWAKDVQRGIHEIRRALLQRKSFIPRDFLQGRSTVEAWRLTRKAVADYGELLHCWPEVLQSADALRQRGTRLSVSIRPR